MRPPCIACHLYLAFFNPTGVRCKARSTGQIHPPLPTKIWISKELETPSIPPFCPFSGHLEILLAPNIPKITIRIHITLNMQNTSQDLWSTEKHDGFCWSVYLADGFKDHIPVWTAEVCGCPKAGDCILFCVGIVDHDVGRVVDADFCCEVLLHVSLEVRRKGVRTLTVWISMACPKS